MYSVFAPKPRPLPACSFLPAVFKAESNFYHRLMPHAQGQSSLYHSQRFSFCDTPGIGTFYDFFSRIWQDGRNTLSPNGRFPKMRLPKGKKTRHSTHYVQYLCPFLGIFFSCTIFGYQFSIGISFSEISRSYYVMHNIIISIFFLFLCSISLFLCLIRRFLMEYKS